MYTLRYKLPHVRDLFMNYFRLIIALFSFICIGNALFSMEKGPQPLAMEKKRKIQACCIVGGVACGAISAAQTSYLWLLPCCIASGIAGAAYVEQVFSAPPTKRNRVGSGKKPRTIYGTINKNKLK